MDRTGKIREYLKPYIVDRVHEKIEEAAHMRESCLFSSVTDLLRNALKQQEKYPQWEPSYMGLFHLMTSLITENHKYELTIANQQMYLDEFRVIGCWQPDFLYQDEVEEKCVRKELEKQFIRLNSYEVFYAKRSVFYEYRYIIGVYWKEHLDEIIKLEEFKTLKKATPFIFLFGDYMGEIHTILNYEEVL